MLYPVVTVLAAGGVLILTVLRYRALGPFIASSASGLAGLWAVSLLSVGSESLVTINAFTLFSSAVLGIPGLIGMLLLRVIALT